MHLLPFDIFSPRSLSIILLGLIILVTQADRNMVRTTSLVNSDSRTAHCANAYVPTAQAGSGCGSRNTIQGGRLTVGKTF